jgi:hydroxymethylglutaryl-CoA synthase
MSLFEKHGADCADIEGVDNYNACYGGTAAFLSTMDWVNSPAWDGRWGIVVCVDIADLNAQQAFLNGASAVAMLVGPDAPVVLAPERASHMIHSWDFYKPVGWKDSFPLMRDGKYSIECYMGCLDGCYKSLCNRVYGDEATGRAPAPDLAPEAGGTGNLVRDHGYFVNHCTSTYLCKRAFKRVCENAFTEGGVAGDGVNGGGKMTIRLKEQLDLYTAKAEPTTLLTKRIGSSYTASCYTNLYSLFATVKEALVGKKVVVYSYGSGSASTMYRLHVNALPKMDMGIFERLDKRVVHEPDSYLEMIDAYSTGTYGRFGFKPKDWGGKQAGVYYLTEVDEWGVRTYEQQS